MQLCPQRTVHISSCNTVCPQTRKPLLKFTSVAYTRQSATPTRCSYRQETERGGAIVPSAPPLRSPPARAPPVPPPPPPPPPPEQESSGISRRQILAVIVAGTCATYGARKSLDPKVYHDKYGVRYLKTGNGQQVAVGTDRQTGNIMMVDPAGNLYYDTGEQKLGFYMVSNKGDLYNMYTDTSGEQQSVLLGNVADLRTVKVKEVGGIPIEKLQAHYEHQRNQRGKRDRGMPSSIVGFPDDRQIELPPNAVKVYENGKNKLEIDVPPVLDEGAIDLEEKNTWWPFAEPGGGPLQRGSG